MRLRSTTNSKSLFFRGISLEDYVRNSPNNFMDQEIDQTIIIDQFSRPLINYENYQQQILKKTNYIEDSEQFQTKAQRTLKAHKEQLLPNLLLQNSIKTKNTPFYQRNSQMFIKDKKKGQNIQLPQIELIKSKNMRKSMSKRLQVIGKKKQFRQKCMASRQLSQQSEEQCNFFEGRYKRALSHRQPNEHIKNIVQLKTDLNVNSGGVVVIKARINGSESLLVKNKK